MNRANIVAVAIVGVVGLAACEKKTPVQPPLPVTVTPVVQQDVVVERTWVGLLNGYQNADIRAQVTGYLLTQNYKEGSVVKKGATLFTIDPRPFQAALAQAQADYAKSVAQAQLAQITLGRQEQLYKTKVISQQEYDTAYQNAQADIAGSAAAQAAVQTAQINLNYCTVTAPFDGIAGLAQAQIGDLVGPGGTSSVLTQMSQVNPIKVNFSITEQEYLRASALLQRLQSLKADELQSRITLHLADGSLYPQKGRFDFVNRQVNAATGTIQITALFDNTDDTLRPGLFAKVTAPVEELKGALLVPQAATVELQGNYMVQVLQPDNTVKPSPVLLGPTQGDMQVILKGVALGEKVVVGGVEKARPGMKVVPQPYVAPTPKALNAPAGKSGLKTAPPSPETSPTPASSASATPEPTPAPATAPASAPVPAASSQTPAAPAPATSPASQPAAQ
jgi:membrane fusion protein (multidrug efflux system)